MKKSITVNLINFSQISPTITIYYRYVILITYFWYKQFKFFSSLKSRLLLYMSFRDISCIAFKILILNMSRKCSWNFIQFLNIPNQWNVADWKYFGNYVTVFIFIPKTFSRWINAWVDVLAIYCKLLLNVIYEYIDIILEIFGRCRFIISGEKFLLS